MSSSRQGKSSKSRDPHRDREGTRENREGTRDHSRAGHRDAPRESGEARQHREGSRSHASESRPPREPKDEARRDQGEGRRDEGRRDRGESKHGEARRDPSERRDRADREHKEGHKEAKDRDRKDREHKDREHKDREHKDREHKDRENKDREHKEREHKDRDHKDREHRDREHRDREHREHRDREHRDREHKDREHKDREHKDREHKDREHKDREHKDRDSKERESKDRGDGRRSSTDGRSHGEARQDGHREHKEGHREHKEGRRDHKDGHREHRERGDGHNGDKETKQSQPPDQEAWLDSLISGTDQNVDGKGVPPPRERIPRRPSSRADSRPKGEFDSSAVPPSLASHGAHAASSAPTEAVGRHNAEHTSSSEQGRAPRVPVPPATQAHGHGTSSKVRPAPQKEVPLTELASDEELEVGPSVTKGTAPPGRVPAAPAQRAGRHANDHELDDLGGGAPIEEDIQEQASTLQHEEVTEDIDEVDYDDDFEEVSGDEEEEYQPQVKPMIPHPPPESEKAGSKLVTIRPQSSHKMRTPSPRVVENAPPVAKVSDKNDIRKAMEDEKKRAQMKANPIEKASGKQGILADYESTMPKFNLAEGSSQSARAALQRLRSLQKQRIPDKRTVEAVSLFQQRPQTMHNLFLSGKSLKYCSVKSVTCQTGEDDVDFGTMTDEIPNDDQEMQFPTLSMGQGVQPGSEVSQILPFLRRVLPLFEASMAESLKSQAHNLQKAAEGTSSMQQRAKVEAQFSLPESFANKYLSGPASVVDLDICPEWYGADHGLVLFSWCSSSPASKHEGERSLLEDFVGPFQSMIGLYPMVGAAGGADASSVRPARCMYSFCRLSALAVVAGRPNLIIAGSEMGSLQVWDLRKKPHAPMPHKKTVAHTLQKNMSSPDEETAHFEGAVWLDAVFSTDVFAFSSLQKNEQQQDEDIDDHAATGESSQSPDMVAGVHSTEICSLRCSDDISGDTLIFALDVSGQVSFWRILELSVQHNNIKLALQGSVCIADGRHALGNFLDASSICVHPQQRAQFVVVSASGLFQAHRQHATSRQGPGTLDLICHAEEDSLSLLSQPCAAAFNPFLEGLLLVAYAQGDLALFDGSLCVPITHWADAVSSAPSKIMAVSWSTHRPCVFFVKSGAFVDVWDLAAKSYAPVQHIDLDKELGSAKSSASSQSFCSEIRLTASGHPLVEHHGRAVILNLPTELTTPLQTMPPKYTGDEKSIDQLLVDGCQRDVVFPTLEKFSRAIDVPKPLVLERDCLRRILSGIHPLQAWV